MNPAYYKISKHFKDYLNEETNLKKFYAQHLNPDWHQLSAIVSEQFKQNDILDELVIQNHPVRNEQVDKNCKLLKEKNTVIIITGQQLGLMVSPLYIIYKTLTTLWLANNLNNEIEGYNFVPVFWLESEDHDYDEIKSVNVPQRDGNLQTFQLPEDAEDSGKSINKRILPGKITELLKELKNTLQPTEFTEDLFSNLEKIYQPGKSWLESFKKNMSVIFKDTGLLFFNAGTARVKELSKPFFKQFILKNKEIFSCFELQSAALEKAGYPNQVAIQADKSYLFLSKDGKRKSLFFNDEGFYLKETNEKFSSEALLEILDKNPEWFSSTVLSRPIWQSYLLPVVSYVAGGAEITYWAQLTRAFEKMEIVMPQVQPRHSITLLEPKTDRHLSKSGLDINSISDSKDDFIKAYFANTHLNNITESLTEFEDHIKQNGEKIKELLKDVDPTLTIPTEKTFSSILNSVEKLQNRMASVISTKETTIRNQLNVIHESILPNGTLQERVVGSVYFQNKFGPTWLDKIQKQLKENFNEHLIVRI